MKKIMAILFVFANLSLFAAESDSLVSFINVSKRDDVMILAKVLSFPDSSSILGVYPKKMQVEIIELLKGSLAKKQITINAQEDSIVTGPFLEYKIGSMYIFSLKNDTLPLGGCHSLSFENNKVTGVINREPSKSLKKNYEKLLKILYGINIREKDYRLQEEKVKKELEALSKSLDDTMSYENFKKLLE